MAKKVSRTAGRQADEQSANGADADTADQSEPQLELASEPDLDQEEDQDLDQDLDLDDVDVDNEDDLDLDKLAGPSDSKELAIRRAIEERQEARRLRDDLDYLDFDD